MRRGFSFSLIISDTKTSARRGVIHTPHGDIQTPAFVPVGTQATVKSLTPEDLKEIGVQLYFVNTYHMYLRPGVEIVKEMGGLHKFMNWDRPLITDSGGFQVFSLGRTKGAEVAGENLDSSSISGESVHDQQSKKKVNPNKILSAPRANESLVKISEDGVEFRSHWDGSKHMFTPERSMQWQWDLGADMHIAFDDCTPYPVTHDAARASMERTHRWAKRSLDEHLKQKQKIASPSERSRNANYQALYGSVQGSVFQDLREESARYISEMDFDGIAIGGVAVGEGKKEMSDVVSWVTPFLPDTKPRHLLGVGEIDDIFMLVENGVDTFDCVQPTRLARVGWVYTKENKDSYTFDITKAAYAHDQNPLEAGCACYTCTHFTRAYIHHLFRVKELLAHRLTTMHNLHFIHALVANIRTAIEQNRFLELKEQWL